MNSDKVELQFQTPQDFQKFRKMASDSIVSVNIAQLSLICDCRSAHIAAAINQFGAIAKDAPGR